VLARLTSVRASLTDVVPVDGTSCSRSDFLVRDNPSSNIPSGGLGEVAVPGTPIEASLGGLASYPSGSMPFQAGTCTVRCPRVPPRITSRSEVPLLVVVSWSSFSGLATTSM
jgi:hypothetical protein